MSSGQGYSREQQMEVPGRNLQQPEELQYNSEQKKKQAPEKTNVTDAKSEIFDCQKSFDKMRDISGACKKIVA